MSISEEQRARIRALFYAEHWKVGTIAAELGVHPDTVKSAVGTDRFVSRGPHARASKLEPYRVFITDTLKQHPRLRATRLYDMLVPRGFEGSERQLRRHVAEVRPRPAPEAFLRLNRMPGEQGPNGLGQVRQARRVGRRTEAVLLRDGAALEPPRVRALHAR